MKGPGIGLLAPWSFPSDALGRGALVAATVFAVAAWHARDTRRPWIRAPHLFVALTATVAATLSGAYVAFVLRGGPRIIDATAYVLEARIFASGRATWQPPGPLASYAGRFLVAGDAPGSLAVLFPPGYPLALAAFVRAGAPMVLGPLLAAAIVLATYALAREWSDDPRLARAAALFSVVSACLRYHTAETMAHGLVALLVTLAVLCALRARSRGPRWAVLAGACAGYAITTRFASGLAIVIIGAWLCRERGARVRYLAGLALGLAPLFLYQWAAFGHPLQAGQSAYYAVSDGPPGCFRYAFGAGIGCVHEHPDEVARLGGHYGFTAALDTTLRRFLFHLGDGLSFEPLFLLVVIGARAAPSMAVLVLTHIALQAPFYFPGTYPGGGARMFADVIPIEHVLAALGIGRLAAQRRVIARATRVTVALALASFGFHNVHDHARLREREGGRPMFREHDFAQVPSDAIVLIDTDHAFNLAAGPGRRPHVARHRGDVHDVLATAANAARTAYLHTYDPAHGTVLVHEERPRTTGPLFYEGESLWPAVAQEHGMAAPVWVSAPCASHARALRITGAATLRLSAPTSGAYDVVLRTVDPSGDCHDVWFARRMQLGPRSTVRIDAGQSALDLDAVHLHTPDP